MYVAEMYSGHEELTEHILHQLVANDMKSTGRFAAHLKISAAKYDNIRYDFHGNMTAPAAFIDCPRVCVCKCE